MQSSASWSWRFSKHFDFQLVTAIAEKQPYIFILNIELSPADARLRRVSFASEANGPQKANLNLILVEFRELKKIYFWTYGQLCIIYLVLAQRLTVPSSQSWDHHAIMIKYLAVAAVAKLISRFKFVYRVSCMSIRYTVGKFHLTDDTRLTLILR
jgi:hypothetical protein